ncbi:uncharacterized protein V6R79_013855 [Siganus canaliculatus]
MEAGGQFLFAGAVKDTARLDIITIFKLRVRVETKCKQTGQLKDDIRFKLSHPLSEGFLENGNLVFVYNWILWDWEYLASKY